MLHKGMKLVITGPAGSGKSHLMTRLRERGHQIAVAHTTRKPREGERLGVDYYFVTPEVFQRMKENKMLLTYFRAGNGTEYGVSEGAWHRGSVVSMTPSEIHALDESLRRESLVVFLDVPLEERRARVLDRENAEEEVRRMETDAGDFRDFTAYDIRITNADF